MGLKCVPTKADVNVWMRDGNTYEYVCVYVAELLYVGHNPNKFYNSLTNLGYKWKGV